MRIQQFFKILCLALISATLVACGGGGAGSSSTPVALTDAQKNANCSTLTAGNKLTTNLISTPATYTVASGGTAYTYQQTSTLSLESSTWAGGAVIDRRLDSFNSAPLLSATSFVMQKSSGFFSVANPAQITLLGSTNVYGASSSTTLVNSTNTYTGHVRDYTKNINEPQTHTYTLSIAPLGQTPTISTVTQVFTFLGVENLSTPAGIFTDACKYSMISPSAQALSTSTLWYAPGYGLVKDTTSTQYSDGTLPSLRSRTSEAQARYAAGSISNFAGTYTCNYSGLDSGSFTAVLSTTSGALSSCSGSTRSGAAFTCSGNVTASGDLSTAINTLGANARGYLTTTGASGVWNSSSLGGTFSCSKS